MKEFRAFSKIPRLFRECIITEKIDGTNASVYIPETPGEIEGPFLVGSRTRWITPEADNYGFARWAHEHADVILQLGPGLHFGEWWGQKINRGYGLKEKRFSLFNTTRWEGLVPPGLSLVPILYTGTFSTDVVRECMEALRQRGSVAAPGFMQPEGVVVYHKGGGMFKATLEGDEGKHGQNTSVAA